MGLASSANREVIDSCWNSPTCPAASRSTVSGDEVPRGKPAPDVYLAAARRLGINPTRTACSGGGLDATVYGSRGRRDAVIAVPNREFPPSADALALADIEVGSLRELTPEFLLRH